MLDFRQKEKCVRRGNTDHEIEIERLADHHFARVNILRVRKNERHDEDLMQDISLRRYEEFASERSQRLCKMM